jgi:RNA polymerase sigma-70 factor (ECF subfamily)
MEQAQDELSVCRRIAQGERHLFAKLIDSYSSLVAGAIAAQGVATADVEDLAQLAFINAYKGIAGFRGDAKLSSWLYRIAVNVARGHLKRLAQRPSAASVEEQAELGQQPADLRAATAAQHAQDTALAAALAQLTEAQRVCISLYYFEELSYEEIAAGTGYLLNTVRTHIRRGKLRLAELLDESLLGEEH